MKYDEKEIESLIEEHSNDNLFWEIYTNMLVYGIPTNPFNENHKDNEE